MKTKIRLAVAAAVALYGLGVAILAKPASALPCAKTLCYAVTEDYEGMGPAVCCQYTCTSGSTWACLPGA